VKKLFYKLYKLYNEPCGEEAHSHSPAFSWRGDPPFLFPLSPPLCSLILGINNLYSPHNGSKRRRTI